MVDLWSVIELALKEPKVLSSNVGLVAPDWMTRREEALECVKPQAGLNWKVLMVLVEIREVEWLSR